LDAALFSASRFSSVLANDWSFFQSVLLVILIILTLELLNFKSLKSYIPGTGGTAYQARYPVQYSSIVQYKYLEQCSTI
jgi:hypothetical protein